MFQVSVIRVVRQRSARPELLTLLTFLIFNVLISKRATFNKPPPYDSDTALDTAHTDTRLPLYGSRGMHRRPSTPIQPTHVRHPHRTPVISGHRAHMHLTDGRHRFSADTARSGVTVSVAHGRLQYTALTPQRSAVATA